MVIGKHTVQTATTMTTNREMHFQHLIHVTKGSHLATRIVFITSVRVYWLGAYPHVKPAGDTGRVGLVCVTCAFWE